VYLEAARRFGEILAENDIETVYGGMDAGMMNALADGALSRGGRVFGIIPRRIADFDRYHKGLTRSEIVDDMWERKQKLFHAADALVFLPGGYGTLDEAFETLYWRILGLHAKPIIFVNISEYWTPLLTFLKTIPDLPGDSWTVVDRVEAVLPALSGSSAAPRPEPTAPLPHFEANSLCDTHLPVIVDSATMSDVCRFMTALILKQLGKHTRPIGILDPGGAFDPLVTWVRLATRERFLTPKCMRLFTRAKTERTLMRRLESGGPVVIDLHREKWGQT
ncbi:MAG TPA: TIGR00730 family Rossman fold protein, partial [Alphaproteobacteria bacterium]|nr:TIGR00730 family Rossman fold protein [Alphaproteobacteria bacterium]